MLSALFSFISMPMLVLALLCAAASRSPEVADSRRPAHITIALVAAFGALVVAFFAGWFA